MTAAAEAPATRTRSSSTATARHRQKAARADGPEQAQGLRRRRRRPVIARRARRVPRRERQVGHREPARLHRRRCAGTSPASTPSCAAGTAAPSASRRSSTSWRTRGCRSSPLPRKEVGKDLDPFDLICHIAFDQPPLTRRERAENVKKARRVHEVRAAGPRAAVLERRLLDEKYQDEGVPFTRRPRAPPPTRCSQDPPSPFDAIATPLTAQSRSDTAVRSGRSWKRGVGIAAVGRPWSAS